MTPRRYTELFFLDEAAAFAAGHRPCAECRNADYKQFAALWETCFGKRAAADEMDVTLHAERLDGRTKRTTHAPLASLPNGTYVVAGDAVARVVWDDALVAWGAGAYGEPVRRPKSAIVEVLTPPSIVAIIRAGFLPGVHPTLAS